MSISGLTYKSNVIDGITESKLMDFIDSQPWSNALKRKVQQYGYEYSYKTRQVDDYKYREIPDILKELAVKLGLDDPNQVIINNYEPGQGIASHIDNKIFDKQIATLSLLSGIQMDFARNSDIHSLYLEPKSLAIFEDDARYEYTHGIVARKSDIVNSKKINRSRRVSITFRKLII